MRFEPISDTDYQKSQTFTPWPAGKYACSIFECEEQVSKAGNPMFKCNVEIVNNAGHSRKVYCYLIAEGEAAWQLRAASEAFGLLEKYKAGELSPIDFEMLGAMAIVGIQPAKGEYQAKNIIKRFEPMENQSAPAVRQEKKAGIDTLDDDIPW